MGKIFQFRSRKKENLLALTALIRKDDFWSVNGYELREKAVNEDWNLWLKFLSKGKKPVRMNFLVFGIEENVRIVNLNALYKTKKEH